MGREGECKEGREEPRVEGATWEGRGREEGGVGGGGKMDVYHMMIALARLYTHTYL